MHQIDDSLDGLILRTIRNIKKRKEDSQRLLAAATTAAVRYNTSALSAGVKVLNSEVETSFFSHSVLDDATYYL